MTDETIGTAADNADTADTTTSPESPPAPISEPSFEPIDLDADPTETTAPESLIPPGGEETTEGKPDPATPSIEAPRSWSKEDKETFASLPPATQQRIAEREKARETVFLQAQQAAVEKFRNLSAHEQAALQARQQYEGALPILLQNLDGAMRGEFADIKSMDDVQAMANDDWPRYIKWDAAQKRVAAVQQQLRSVQQRQNAETVQRWQHFSSTEDAAFRDKVPEAKDQKQWAELQEASLAVLQEAGFTPQDIAAAWQGHTGISLRDHKAQMIIRDAARWRMAERKFKAASAPAALPRPQVPGAPASRSSFTDLQSAAEKGDMGAFIKMRNKGVAR